MRGSPSNSSATALHCAGKKVQDSCLYKSLDPSHDEINDMDMEYIISVVVVVAVVVVVVVVEFPQSTTAIARQTKQSTNVLHSPKNVQVPIRKKLMGFLTAKHIFQSFIRRQCTHLYPFVCVKILDMSPCNDILFAHCKGTFFRTHGQ